MPEIRMDKFVASQLNISRSDAKKLIRKGQVILNGKAVSKGDSVVKTEADTVSVCGKEITYKQYVYIMLNKPQGVVSAASDASDTTVVDILPENLKRKGLFPAGRLDKDTVGFVLITDNGEFAHDILSPSHHVPKTYLVEVERILNEDEIKRFLSGMCIGTEQFKPAQLQLTEEKSEKGNFIYEIKISEGRYHQIKRMFAAVSNPVISLKRTAIGGLKLDENLNPGEARELSASEIETIYSNRT